MRCEIASSPTFRFLSPPLIVIMSSPEPELAATGAQPQAEEGEQAGDRYDVTGPEGGDGQPEVRQGGGLLDIVSDSLDSRLKQETMTDPLVCLRSSEMMTLT